jgi:hypothetical protein
MTDVSKKLFREVRARIQFELSSQHYRQYHIYDSTGFVAIFNNGR